MRKRLTLFVLIAYIVLSAGSLLAQPAPAGAAPAQNPAVTDTAKAVTPAPAAETTPAPEKSAGWLETIAINIFGSGLVKIFNDGGFCMWPILVVTIWGLATVIWKLIVLSYAKINLNVFLSQFIPMVRDKKYEDAIALCQNTRGPVAAILKIGLMKADKGVESVEKAIENAGVLEMAFLEKGFIPIGSCIALAPMLGFFGTVVGMIQAFEAIYAAGEIEPQIVADGIKVALITTAGGLAAAMPLQLFNNIFLSMVDGLTIDMQKGSEKLVETLIESKSAHA
jgi:biopolymer transport protein ExbB